MRRIILSEQGFHSLDNSLESQKIQAAAYALAYYKSKFLDGIDSPLFCTGMLTTRKNMDSI